MSKKQFMLYIEEQVMNTFQEVIGKGNVSSKVEDYMNNMVNVVKQDSTGINVRLIRNKINDLEKDGSKISAELTSLKQQLQMYEKVQAENETKKLEQEKERIENQNKCANCGNILGEKVRSHKFSIGLICNPCFITSNKESIKKWTNE
jgi:hypothetical protein